MHSPGARQFSEPAAPTQRSELTTRYTLQQVMQWNEHRVCQWVCEQGFGKYENAFRDNLITGEALVELDYGLLKELSVRTVGERVRLDLAIRRLRQQCLQVDTVEVHSRNKRSATIDGLANSPSAFHGADLVSSPGPMSTATSTATAVALDTATSTFGFKKDLPILPRTSLSSNSIGLGDLESAGITKGIKGIHRNSGNLMHRANTDMRSFSLRDKDSPAYNLAGVTIRKPKPTHIGSPTLAAPTLNESTQRSADSGATSQQPALSVKTGTGSASAFRSSSEPMSAPVHRLRMLAGTHRPQQQKSPPLASSKLKSHLAEQGEEIERLGFQLQDFFGSDISVAHLADSLSVRTWQIAVTGPENQVRHVLISNTSSAKVILDRVRRAFDLDNDADGDQYSLFSMTSEGGGARCLSNDELVKMFSDPSNTPPDKFFLRKRHQLTRPPMSTKRSEHLQRAIERLGNILPMPSANASAQQQQPILQRSISKWESTTEKLTKILGERPPSELVSMNVEKYFPGNEARARHSVMRRRKNESMEAAGADGLDGSLGRSSRRQSRAHRRSSNSSARAMQARIRSATTVSDDRSSAFSNSLEPIEESLTSPAPVRTVAAPPPIPALPALPPVPRVPPVPTAPPVQETLSEAGPLKSIDTPSDKENNTDKENIADKENSTDRPQSKQIASSPQSPNRSCASLQFSDEDTNNMGTLSDLSLSDALDSDCSSFYESLSDSDIDADLADCDSDHPQSIVDVIMPANAGDDKAPADERRQSVARSVSTMSRAGRAHAKKKTWIKGKEIASGSFGSVFFGMNTRTGAIMAVKEVDMPKPGTVSMARNQRMADALRHELDLLKGLDHKNVVKYMGTDMDESKLYIFLEYVSGGSVTSALASYGMFPESLVRTYTAQIIEGLVYLHGQGIIHRDIKGGNVLIDQDGSVKISDFGISKRVDEVVVAAANKAGRRASLQGSVFWMAPEVVKDTHYTVKGDVWSLGCLVIEMLTGAHPFPDLDQMQALYTIGQRGRPQIPSSASAVAQEFLDQALQVDLEMRPTATDLIPHEFVTNFEPPSP
ncbi:ATP binding [Coemansia erecta]|nr:ATP binding [Coemansia erecta]